MQTENGRKSTRKIICFLEPVLRSLTAPITRCIHIETKLLLNSQKRLPGMTLA
jgi:hypothetical protein